MNPADSVGPPQAKAEDTGEAEPPSYTGSTALVPVGQANGVAPVDDGLPGWLARLFGFRKRGTSTLRADLADALSDEAAGHLAFTAEEKLMLNNILRLRDVRVEDLMVPRADIEAVEIGISLGELLKIFEESGHSRMPVYGETLDDPRGMVHIRDVVAHITKTAAMTRTEIAARKKLPAANLDLKKVGLDKPLGSLKIIRKVLFVPPSMQAVSLLARMQAARTQMALVIDEYGGTEGIISLEDIVEVIVGDIEDEHDDDDEPMILDKGDGVFVIDAKAELDDVADAVGADFQIGEHGEDVDTIGGLVFALIGRVPVRGEVIEGLGYEFRVIDADPRRIKRIELLPAKRRRMRKAG
jgi:CBS domain containing-hemolysin-like protein